MALKTAIAKIINSQNLALEEAEEAMHIIMSGDATPAQIGSYLTALRMKGETVEEIAGSARAMRSHVIPVSVMLKPGEVLVDTCGTGGDGSHSFNISTTAAFVVAAAGIKVAKHGNRAASSKSGSADLLLALGGNLDLSPTAVSRTIEETNIGFLYAVNHHPAMRFAIGPRRELGQRTIFNLLGPLTNPAAATHQLIGVYHPSLTKLLAEVLAALGSQEAMIVHGAGGLDELSTSGPNQVSRLHDGKVESFALDPLSFGFAQANKADFAGGLPEDNAKITRDILSGKDKGPRRDIVILNAGAVISLATGDMMAGIEKANKVIDDGTALDCLERWVMLTNQLSDLSGN